MRNEEAVAHVTHTPSQHRTLCVSCFSPKKSPS